MIIIKLLWFFILLMKNAFGAVIALVVVSVVFPPGDILVLIFMIGAIVTSWEEAENKCQQIEHERMLRIQQIERERAIKEAEFEIEGFDQALNQTRRHLG